MCGLTGFLKAIVYFINVLLLLAGVALLAVGVVAKLKFAALTDVVEGRYENCAITTMVVGGVILLFGLLGCCGAIRESKWMLITYSIFIIMLMILKLALAVMVYFYSDTVVHFVREEFAKYFITNQSAFHRLETSLRCCGPIGPRSYPSNMLPKSCCPVDIEADGCILTDAYAGCDSVVADLVYTSAAAIGGVCVAVAALELLAVTYVLCLAKHVRNK